MQRVYTLTEYLEIARRRKWVLIIPSVVVSLLATGACFLLPPKYTSQTLVLVEQPKVAESLVKPAINEDLERRLSTMKQQILSRTRLQPIMQRFGLYKEQMSKKPLEELVDQMRKNILIEPIHGANNSTPGFYIAFTASTPKMAQDVCAEITSLFMEENLKIREEQAVGTTQFLTSQLEDAKKKLDEQDSKLATFKSKYIGQMPEQEQLNLNLLSGLKSQLDANTEALSRARQDKAYAESLLAQQKQEWEQSRAATEQDTPIDALDAQLTKKRADLVALESRYTASHPDVIKLKSEIAQMEKRKEDLSALARSSQSANHASAALPPQIQNLQNQVHALEETINAKTAQQARMQQDIQKYEARLQLSPMVEEQIKALTRDYQTANAFYQDLLAKKTQSEMSTDLERRQEGEQFRIMDPANLPETPSFPVPWTFGAGGFALGLAIGAGIIFLLDFAAKAIRSGSDIEFYLKLPVLATVPELAATSKSQTAGKRPQPPGSKRAPAVRIGA